MKTFRQALQKPGLSLTAELHLERSTTIDEVLSRADALSESVDAIQVVENPYRWVQVSPIALASLLIRQGIDPVPQITCRDRNLIALQSDLLGLRTIGVSSLILDRGRQVPTGPDRLAKSVHDVRCRELVAAANAMNEEEWSGGEHEFVVGTSATACKPAHDWNPEPLEARAHAGARFLQLRLCLDLDLLRRYMQQLVEKKLTWSYSVIVTLAPIPCARTARWLAENSHGAVVPHQVVKRLEDAANPEKEGIDICAGLISDVASVPGVSGVNLLTLGNPGAVKTAIMASGIRD